MDEKQQKAIDQFFNGFNCCQAVASAFASKYNIPEEAVLRISSPFGGGMRKKEVCGAVTGGLMALGMKYGQIRQDDKESKERINALTGEFMSEFAKRHGSYLCRDLLGDKYWRDVCGNLVASAIALAEEFGV